MIARVWRGVIARDCQADYQLCSQPEYTSIAELEAACEQFRVQVNSRVHRVTRRVPDQRLVEEATRLHGVSDEPHTVVFGLARRVPVNTPMMTFEHGQYSVPQHLLGEQVWVRALGAGDSEQVIIVHLSARGPVEVARHTSAPPPAARAWMMTISAGRRRNSSASTGCTLATMLSGSSSAVSFSRSSTVMSCP